MTWLYKPDSPTNDTYFTFLSEYENMWKGQLELEMVLFAIITVVGTVGNVLILMATWRHKRPLSTWQYLLAGQCLSDLLLTLFNPVVMATRVTRDWVLGLAPCVLTNYLQYATASTSILCMTTLAVDRYLAICRPPGAGNPLHSHVAKVMAATWVAPLVWFFPFCIAWKVFQVRQDRRLYTFCYLQWPDGFNNLAFTLVSGVVVIVSPVVVIAVCYTRVFITVRRSARRVSAAPSVRLSAVQAAATPVTRATDSTTAGFQVKDSNSATTGILRRSAGSVVTFAAGSGGDKGSAGDLGSNSATSANLVIPDATSTNLVIPDAASTNLVIPDATSTNLVIPDATTNGHAHSVSAAPNRHAHSLSRRRAVERRLVRLLVLSVACYSLMWLPFFAAVVYVQLVAHASSSVYVYFYMLAVCNSCVNPVLILYFNDRYRACVADLLPGGLGAWLRPPGNQKDSQPGPSTVTEPDNTRFSRADRH